MDSIESYLRKLIVASVGAADLGCEKLGKLLDECVARGEVTVEKGRVLNEELKRTCKQAVTKDEDEKPAVVSTANNSYFTDEVITDVAEKFVEVFGLTDDPANVALVADHAAGLGNVERVDILPFHQLGEHKWRERGLDYKLAGVRPPAPETVIKARDIFRAAGLLAY